MTDESTNPIPDAPEPIAAPEPPPAPAAPPAPGYAPPPPPGGYVAPGYAPQATPASDKNKMVAGILAILLGSLGIHKFYLGYTKEGIIMLAVTLVGGMLTFGLASGAMSVIALVEGIMYLTKTDQDFYATYVAGRKAWF